MRHRFLALLPIATLALAGCQRQLEIDSSGGVTAVRSACPGVGVAAQTGDLTLFNPETSRDAAAIDVTANITDLRTSCATQGPQIVSTTDFQVHAQRRDPRGARQITLPYFATVLQAGTNVVSKRVSRVQLNFADGQVRASTSGQASAVIDTAAATLPAEVTAQINRRRRPGDQDAAVDPLADPAVRQAVARATFELLIGFQLTPDQLRYNATR